MSGSDEWGISPQNWLSSQLNPKKKGTSGPQQWFCSARLFSRVWEPLGKLGVVWLLEVFLVRHGGMELAALDEEDKRIYHKRRKTLQFFSSSRCSFKHLN